MKTNTTTECYFCTSIIHPDDLDIIEIDTLESVQWGMPKAKAHALCAAEADAEIEDRERDDDLAFEVDDA